MLQCVDGELQSWQPPAQFTWGLHCCCQGGYNDTQQVTLTLLHQHHSVFGSSAMCHSVCAHCMKSREASGHKHTAKTKHTDSLRTYIALTSLRTAAGYGRGARVRTLVPSRILPRASPVNPNSCSQGGRKRGGGEAAACVSLCRAGRGWRRIDDGWMDRWVCARLAFSPLCLCPPLSGQLSAAVSSRALTARGDWSGPGNWYLSCGARGYNGRAEREKEGGGSGGERESRYLAFPHGLIDNQRRVSQTAADRGTSLLLVRWEKTQSSSDRSSVEMKVVLLCQFNFHNSHHPLNLAPLLYISAYRTGLEFSLPFTEIQLAHTGRVSL